MPTPASELLHFASYPDRDSGALPTSRPRECISVCEAPQRSAQMTPRKTPRVNPAKLTPIGSFKPELAFAERTLSLRERFSPTKLLPVTDFDT